jgi:superfamily II DNA or RNA helicase
MSFQLRQYQTDIIDDTRTHFKNGIRSVALQLPTGAGKTCLAAKMLDTSASRGFNSWFIVHRRELVKQTILAFSDIGIKKFGVVAAGFSMAKGFPIQICSIQTLMHRHTHLKRPSFMVWDEFHHLGAKTWAKIYSCYPKAYHIGLSATPRRLDGQGLSKFFDVMVQGPSMNWLIENEYLIPYKIYAPSSINVVGVHTQMGDFQKAELAAVADKPSITGDAIKHYRKHADGKRAVVFCVSIEHSKHVVSQFNQAGIRAEHVDGETPTEERDLSIRRFTNGEIKILSNVELFGEGFNLPSLEAVIMLRPTMSIGNYLQQCGRVLRPSPGKTHAVILDHAGNCERHGLPDEEREWNLDGIEGRRIGVSSVSVKICSRCYAAQFTGNPICKFCGFQFAVESRQVDQKDGELVEVDQAAIRKQRLIAQGRCKTKEELVAEGVRRGYKKPQAWAQFVFQARQAKHLQGVERKPCSFRKPKKPIRQYDPKNPHLGGYIGENIL